MIAYSFTEKKLPIKLEIEESKMDIKLFFQLFISISS